MRVGWGTYLRRLDVEDTCLGETRVDQSGRLVAGEAAHEERRVEYVVGLRSPCCEDRTET